MKILKMVFTIAILQFLIFSLDFNNGSLFASNSSNNTAIEKYNDLLSLDETNANKYKSELSKGAVLNLDKETLSEIKFNKLQSIELKVPYEKGKEFDLELTKVNIGSDEFKITMATGQSKKQDLGEHYRGTVKGYPESFVAISMLNDEMMGLINVDGESFSLGKIKAEDGKHILYNTNNLKVEDDMTCYMPDDNVAYPTNELTYTGSGMNGDCIEVYLEVDYDIYQDKGSNTAGFITGLFNQSATIYANDGINLILSEIYIWNGVSPYNATTTSGNLNQFQTEKSSTFTGDLAHLISYGNGSGGIAAGFNGLCNPNRALSMCYSEIFSSYSNVPNYSWSVFVITHEMGHLLGSRHTHACVWNGNGTAIDGCSGFTEGSCAIPNPQYPTSGGTIMSYCHFQNNIDFTKGFGPQPRSVILNRIENANCLDCPSPPDPCDGFEDANGPWSQMSGDDGDWTRNSGGTPSSSTGPSAAYEGNYYMYIESSASPSGIGSNKIARLKVADTSIPNDNDSYNISFSYSMNGINMGTLKLMAFVDNNMNNPVTLWQESGNKGINWLTESINLDAYKGSTLELYFEGITGSSFRSDMAVDDICIDGGDVEPPCTDISNTQVSEGFEVGFGEWINDTADDLDWLSRSGSTPSSGTGPTSAAEGSTYIYVEASGQNTGYPNKIAIIESPCLDISNTVNPTIDYSYHQYGSQMGTLYLDVNINGNWLMYRSSSSSNINWRVASHSLAELKPYGTIKLRFRAVTGSGYKSDIAIDDIVIYDEGTSAKTSDNKENLNLIVEEGISVEVYPNPISTLGTIEFSLKTANNVSIDLINNTGQVVKTILDVAPHSDGTHSIDLNTANLPSGIYILRLATEDEMQTKKIIIN